MKEEAHWRGWSHQEPLRVHDGTGPSVSRSHQACKLIAITCYTAFQQGPSLA